MGRKNKNYSEKIKIIRSGNIIPWLVSSKLVIHNGCNTAIEGLLLDQTIISYRPYKDFKVETYLPNAISIEKISPDNVINFINNFEANQHKIEKK